MRMKLSKLPPPVLSAFVLLWTNPAISQSPQRSEPSLKALADVNARQPGNERAGLSAHGS
jgi:hypothetical protein